jgi:hypothetical protein
MVPFWFDMLVAGMAGKCGSFGRGLRAAYGRLPGMSLQPDVLTFESAEPSLVIKAWSWPLTP